MGILHNLKLKLAPPKISDLDFGTLLFTLVPEAPEESYWECEWTFPKTGSKVTILLPGTDSGPMPEARQFFLTLPGRYEQILSAARPKLEEAFEIWVPQGSPADVFTAVKLLGFGVEDPKAQIVQWNAEFETIGETWLGITIPFVGNEAQEAIVDT